MCSRDAVSDKVAYGNLLKFTGVAKVGEVLRQSCGRLSLRETQRQHRRAYQQEPLPRSLSLPLSLLSRSPPTVQFMCQPVLPSACRSLLRHGMVGGERLMLSLYGAGSLYTPVASEALCSPCFSRPSSGSFLSPRHQLLLSLSREPGKRSQQQHCNHSDPYPSAPSRTNDNITGTHTYAHTP